MTFKFDGWPWKTIGILFCATSSFVYHFTATFELKLELQSGNAQIGATFVMISVTLTFDLWPWSFAWASLKISWRHGDRNTVKKVPQTDGQTDRQTDRQKCSWSCLVTAKKWIYSCLAMEFYRIITRCIILYHPKCCVNQNNSNIIWDTM